MLDTQYKPVGTRFALILGTDSRDPIFNSRNPNRVPKIPQKKPCNSAIKFKKQSAKQKSAKTSKFQSKQDQKQAQIRAQIARLATLYVCSLVSAAAQKWSYEHNENGAKCLFSQSVST